MKRLSVVMIVVIVMSVLLTACGGGGGQPAIRPVLSKKPCRRWRTRSLTSWLK